MVDSERPLRIGSLFSGIGGLDLGVHRALRRMGIPFVSEFYLEREAFGASVLVAAMDRGELAPAPVWVGDVERFEPPAADLVIAGFPCQPASSAGKRRGVADERWLWPEVVRVVRDSGASLVFLENVRGLLTVNGGRAFGEVLRDLAGLGFDAEWALLTAAEVGAPHRRERVFVLAHRERAGRRSASRTDEVQRACVEQQGGAGSDELRGDALRRPRIICGGVESGCDVAHRAGDGLNGDRERDGGRSPGAGTRRDDADRCDPAVADAPLTGGGAIQLPGCGGRAIADGAGRWPRPWPPGPGARDEWRRILERDPGLAPAAQPDLRGVAHGLPSRLDRLRALGNAVVPAQARLAFVELWERIGPPTRSAAAPPSAGGSPPLPAPPAPPAS